MNNTYQHYISHLQRKMSLRRALIGDVEQELRCLRYDMSDAYNNNEEDVYIDLKYNNFLPLKRALKKIVDMQKTEKEMVRYFIQRQNEWNEYIKAERGLVEELDNGNN